MFCFLIRWMKLHQTRLQISVVYSFFVHNLTTSNSVKNKTVNLMYHPRPVYNNKSSGLMIYLQFLLQCSPPDRVMEGGNKLYEQT